MKLFVKTSKIHLSAVSILPINREVMMMMMMMINIRILIGAMKTSKIHLSAISVLSIKLKKKGDCLPYPSLPPPLLSPCTELTAHENTRDSDLEATLSHQNIPTPSPGGKADQPPLPPPSDSHPPCSPPHNSPTRWCRP